jgi:hypothetical protein
MKLSNEKRSRLRPDVVYAVKGEEVKMISERGTVLIVETAAGNRFAVRKEEVTEEAVEQSKEEEVNHILKPNTVSKLKKSSRPGSQNQNSLF